MQTQKYLDDVEGELDLSFTCHALQQLWAWPSARSIALEEKDLGFT
jgi:hypothetical protein